MSHHRVLWILQWVMGLYFVGVGVTHFVLPEGLPEMISWMYDLSDTQHVLAGSAEILGGLALILPGLTKMAPALTIWAALGLIVVMVAAAVWHAGREEYTNIGLNVFNIALLGYIAYGRARLAPITSET